MQTTRNCSSLRATLLAAVASGCAICVTLPAHASHAASIDADTRQAILDCTFEVLSDLRDDAPAIATTQGGSLVRVAGTASCFGQGQLVTAAHVLDQVLGGRFEKPVVRDRRGREYPIEKIVRYSMRDDFAVFTATGLSASDARPHSAEDVDGTLYLAWRRGDGDILFSSTQYHGRSTLENLGRDGWIQFGPAPGHGASGAAVFDSHGRIVGLINGRSSESDDAEGFAVPIALVDSSSTEWAEIGMRDPLRMLGMPSQRNQPLVGGIPLPSPYAKFEQHMIEVRRTYFAHMLPYSLSLAGTDAPMSDSQRVALCKVLGPGYCDEMNDALTTPVRAEKSGRGCSGIWNGVATALIRCPTRGSELASTRASDDPRTQLAATTLGRRIAPAPPAPCTNHDPLGNAVAGDPFTDHTGAQWQVRAWPVQGCDWVVISMSRPTPDGTLTLVRGAPSAYSEPALMQLKALTSIQCETCKALPLDETAILAEVRKTQPELQR